MIEESRKNKKSKVKRILLIVAVVLIVLIISAPMALAIYIYQSNFNEHLVTPSWLTRSVDEFVNLKVTECTYPSNDGQLLNGYLYEKNDQIIRGILVIAHGLGGGGQNSYMDVADYFASNGYLVFAYDATGNDKSEGDNVRGIPQGLIDLDTTISYIEEQEQWSDYPIVLWGHSWGAYSCGSVLNLHPEVKAVVMVAGFNASSDIIEAQGREMAGDAIELMMPFLNLYERMKFGKYASYTCMDGFERADAGVLIMQSEDDEMIPYEDSYQVFYNQYKDNDRFVFISYPDRGHNYPYYSEEAKEYRAKFNADFKIFYENLGTEMTEEIRKEYFAEHVDFSKVFELDEDLMGQILDFYNSYTE